LINHSMKSIGTAKEGWQAGLQLELKDKKGRTVLLSSKHYGPLRVQRPFYPEGPVCHLYLLHPPGGLVAGDSLAISVELGTRAHALITTPAAGKLYRVMKNALDQYQGVKAKLASGAVLEWMPQETIIYNNARGTLLNRFDLEGDALLIGWDIICLGRRASGEQYTGGRLKQCIEIYRDGKPLYIDRVTFNGGSDMLKAPWGMNGASVSGTMFITLGEDTKLSLDDIREKIPKDAQWGISQRGEVLLLRYLGHSAESCRRGFEVLWQTLRPTLLKIAVHRPRIWNT
jgi:urease accessory protein